jgi:hypothetical protein
MGHQAIDLIINRGLLTQVVGVKTEWDKLCAESRKKRELAHTENLSTARKAVDDTKDTYHLTAMYIAYRDLSRRFS